MKRGYVFGCLLSAGLGLLGYGYYRTDSAPTTSMPSPAPLVGVFAEGHLVAYPGAEVTVGADFSGRLQTLVVQEKDVVRKGQLLAEIYADDWRAALDQARARVVEIDADIELNRFDLARAESLVHSELAAQQLLDRSRRDLSANQARRATAQAEIRRIEAVLTKMRLLAPLDGVVIERHVDEGEMVTLGTPVVTIADLARVRIEAEVDEFDVARIKPGGAVVLSAEGYDESWRGHVEEIPDRVSNRRIKPQDPARPIDTRVLPTKVALDGPTPLKLGQRVEVRFVEK